MTVICNATPLINFAAIERLDIMKTLFKKVIIPEAVYQETTQFNFPSAPIILQAVEQQWLEIHQVTAIPDSISNLLDDGEREVIALALQINEKRVLLDEKSARQIAKNFNLQIIGTLGILVLAKQNQIIPQVKPLLDEMIIHARYWVNASLYQQILQQVKE
jgi:predicted nucleic acid-binding protein